MGRGRRGQALRRELTEEIAVDAPVLHLIDDRTDFDLVVWHATRWTGTVQNRQLEEHDEVSWLAEAELRDLNYADKRCTALRFDRWAVDHLGPAPRTRRTSLIG